jgi:glycosyltransferase involved in cell wall biosynthesis
MGRGEPSSIVHVIGNVAVGGAEHHLVDLVQGLAGFGARVNVVCPRRGPLSERLIALGVPVQFLEMVQPLPGDEYALDRSVVDELRAWFGQWKPDVVHSHLYPAHLHASPAADLAGVPAIVQTAHTLAVRPGDLALDRLTPARTIATSHAAAAALIHAGMSHQRIEVIHNGVGYEHVSVDRAAVRRVRSELALNDGPVVGTVARLSREKGLDLLVTALRDVVEQFPSVTTLIVGDGPEEVSLRELAAALGISGSVRFVGARDDVAALNRLLDVFVLPSREEACPMALLEAMAAGRAVVATRVGGSPELIDNGADGLLVAPEEPGALSAAIVRLLQQRAQREALGSAAREKVARSFTRERMVCNTYAYYERALAD